MQHEILSTKMKMIDFLLQSIIIMIAVIADILCSMTKATTTKRNMNEEKNNVIKKRSTKVP